MREKIYNIVYMNSSEAILNYANNTKNVCSLLGIGLFFIIIFILTPIDLGKLPRGIGKCIIIIILLFVLYKQFTETNLYLTTIQNNVYNNESLLGARSSMILSYVFIICICVLIIYILKTLFN